MKNPDLVVVGAGFFGLTIAERASRELGLRVLVLESRNHIGGNAYSYPDPSTGIEVHAYGSHLFHTSNERVWNYVNRFASFNDYVHTVVSHHAGQIYSMPVNLLTMSQLFGRHLSPESAKRTIEQEVAELKFEPGSLDSFEARALRAVGPTIYSALFRDYTWKQWQTDPTDLPGEIFSRLPLRYTFSNRYFSDRFEGLPTEGYGQLFARMVENPSIEVQTNVDFFSTEHFSNPQTLTVYTGPIDRFFSYAHGVLGWRTLDFEFETVASEDFQGTSVVNYPDKEFSFTRIHEFRHFQPDRTTSSRNSVIAREFSRKAGPTDPPYYPVNSYSDRDSLIKYRELAKKEDLVLFGGRLGSYLYLDMHMAIASAFNMFESQIVPHFVSSHLGGREA